VSNIILVTGGREYADAQAVAKALAAEAPVDMIIEGGAKGADRLGRAWAIRNGVHYATVPALWDTYEYAAGPIRNSAMLLLRPTKVVAFPGGKGTADMVRKAKKAGVPVTCID
jgi:aspartokinase-like uncharacterized kinase